MKLLIAALAWVVMAVSVSAQDSYLLKPGDVLRIEVLEDASLNREEFILPDGQISFPLVGTVQAGGRTIGDLSRSISSALAPNFAVAPTVFISPVSLSNRKASGPAVSSTLSVYVAGEVNTPGKRQIESGTTLLQFLAEVGGFSRFAATKRLQLRRTGVDGTLQTFIINYKDIDRGGTLKNNFLIQEGDILIVPQRRLFE